MHRLAPLVLIAVVLAGCTSPAATGTDEPSAFPSETPSPAPSPTTLTSAEAGEAYLAIVCPANATWDASYVAFQAVPQDLAAIQATAAAARDASQTAALAIDDVEWPDEVLEDVTTVQDEYFAATAAFNQVAASPTLDAANLVPFDQTSGEAAQRVRARTGLSADSAASCAQ